MKLMLKGKRVVLTRSASLEDEWEQFLIRRGAHIHSFPMIKTETVGETAPLRRTFARLGNFGWVVFTSAAGPRSFKELCKKMGVTVRRDQMPPIAAIGKKTAAAVRAAGYRVVFVPTRSDSATLARELKPIRSPVLLLRADIASKNLPKALRKRGMRVVDLPVYKTVMVRTPDPRLLTLLKADQIDYLIFASPSAVDGFVAQIKGNAIRKARGIAALALGQRIGTALRRAGFHDIHIAPEPNLQGVVRLFGR